jgi:hypothetical protein
MAEIGVANVASHHGGCRVRSFLFALLVVPILPAVAVAQPGYAVVTPNCSPAERYYVTLFGGQGDFLRPRTAHTWATFVRTAATPAGEQVVSVDTISWLPATLNVRPWALRAETGVNLTLEQSLEFMAGRPRSRVAAFGPYEITADRYQQALAQKTLLESGAIKYHSLGLFGRRSDVMHCIDGVTRIDARWEDEASPSRWYGVTGTRQAARAAARSGVILNPSVTHPWLLHRLNTDGYDLKARRLGPLVR